MSRAENESLKRHQEMYKAKTPPWKDAFREKCFKRLRNSRNKLTDRFRRLDVQCNCEDIKTLVEEEWRSMDDKQELVGCEVDLIVSIMDEVAKELIEEEKRMLAENYTNFESSSLESQVTWLQQEEVICPLCKKFPLAQDHSIIFCKCGMKINTEQDGLTLMHVKAQLHQGLGCHSERCSSSPSFSLICFTDVTNLVIICDVCSFMYIVI